MKQGNPKKSDLVAQNLRFAKNVISKSLSRVLLDQLQEITRNFSFSLRFGDLLLLSGGWYVTHTGLIRLAKRCRCSGIQVQPVRQLSDQATNRYTFRATVYKSARCRGFVGYGDADPNNVSSRVHGAEMRVAETRAVNRALRKAYGIGICSVEEIGSLAEPSQPSQEQKKLPPRPANGNGGGRTVRDRLCQIGICSVEEIGSLAEPSQPSQEQKKLPPRPANGNGGGRTVRDRLCQVIRQHQLDPNLVKAYATDFCGAKTLREATREQVESFVAHLADWAEKDRNALLCQLNSYLGKKEGAA